MSRTNNRINSYDGQKPARAARIVTLAVFLFICSNQVPEPATAGEQTGNSSKTVPMPWSFFVPRKAGSKSIGSDTEGTRSLTLYSAEVPSPAIETTNPNKWKSFNPDMFDKKQLLVPDPILTDPYRYEHPDLPTPQDPSAKGIMIANGKTTVFAHQGMPTKDGWIAPEAGYAYQVEDKLIFGTTNYTPINYGGQAKNYLGLDRIPVSIISPTGSREGLDPNRVFFAVKHGTAAQQLAKVYPSVIYLKADEKVDIEGCTQGLISCPPPNRPLTVSANTANGAAAPASITVMSLPDNPVFPGKISP